MKILVTGSSGFVGQTLIPLLVGKGHEIVGVDLKEEKLSHKFLKHDLTSGLMEENLQFDLCIHLASHVGGILHNHQDGLEEYELLLLKSVKQLCEKSACKRIIYSSSINVFEKTSQYPHGRLQSCVPQTPYAKGKVRGEEFVENHFEEFVVVRPTNIFGKSQLCLHPDRAGFSHVIPDLLRKIDEGGLLDVLGDGSQIRNFIHVQDVCCFIESVLEAPAQAWYNLRSDIHISIRDLVVQLLEFRGLERQISYKPEYLKFEPEPISLFDMKDVCQNGWKAQVSSIESGLQF